MLARQLAEQSCTLLDVSDGDLKFGIAVKRSLDSLRRGAEACDLNLPLDATLYVASSFGSEGQALEAAELLREAGYSDVTPLTESTEALRAQLLL